MSVAYPFHSIQKALAWLEKNSPSHLINPSLKEVNHVACLLGLTQFSDTAKVITIAGSNGKGSTCFFAENIALEHQQKVGLYTSPHLISFNERIRVNGENISDSSLLEAFNVVFRCCVQQQINLSYFEFTTLCALWCFKQAKCHVIILEVGLGGRLDATNVVDNDCAVITSISLEHKQWLGDSLSAIAREKAGIIKKHKAVVLNDTLPQVCIEIAEEKNATILRYHQEFTINMDNGRYTCEEVALNDRKLEKSTFNLSPLIGDSHPYQCVKMTNLALAIASLSVVGIKLQSALINNALANKQLSGRLQPFHYGALKGWLDVAHNPESVANLSTFLHHLIDKETIRVDAVFACLDDKEMDRMIEIIQPYIRQWHIIELSNPRAMSQETIVKALVTNGVDKCTVRCYREENFMCQIRQHHLNMNANVNYAVFGSFVLVGLAHQEIHS